MRILLWLLSLVVLLTSVGVIGGVAAYAHYAKDLPDYTQLDRRRVFQTARILDRNGELLSEISDPDGGRRTVVALDAIPLPLRAATIAAEDPNFYQHPGFDVRAILRAFYQNVRDREIVSGASTITQQLVKNTLLSPEQTPDRKIKEAMLAIEVTRRYSKDRILELYLNEVYYGNLAYGVEAAAQTYFGRSVGELSLAEQTFIAGLPQAPSTYDPYTHPQDARERQDYVLEQMVRHGLISREQSDGIRSQPIQLRPLQQTASVKAPHFVGFIRDLLERSYSADTLFREGLQIKTTLDLRLQRTAEEVARAQIAELRDRNATNAAVVAIQPSSGEIVAMVGSVDYANAAISGQVNVALRNRQPGSTLKPFTYLAAFEQGRAPATMVMDVPTTFGGDYTPLNYDQKFRGPVSIRRALAASLNVPAVKVLEEIGIEAMLATAHRMGINGLADPNRYGLSVTLGGGEVTLLDLTFAYTPFATGGTQTGLANGAGVRTATSRAFEPVAILEIKNGAGALMYRHEPKPPHEVAKPSLAYLITSILSDDEARAETYGANSPLTLSRPAGAKTGTTDDFRDSWVVGYTPDLVTGVWVGNSDGSPMKDVLGASGAGKIWHAFMESALANVPPRPFPRPNDIVEREVCVPSGLLPTPECPKKTVDLFSPENDPLPAKKYDDIYTRVEVCKVNGKLAFDLVPANARESKVVARFPRQYAEWASKNGYPVAPTVRCDDVYRGVKTAEITAPGPEAPGLGQVQVVGSAKLDDFHHLDLDIGAGAEPTSWSTLTNGQTEGVDGALLGVLDTSGMAPGRYTLRLSVVDRFGNAIQRLSPVTVGAAASPVPSPGPVASPPAPTLFGPTPGPSQQPALAPSVGASPAPTPGLPGQSAPAQPVPAQPSRAAPSQPPGPRVTPTRSLAQPPPTPTPRPR